MPSVKVKQPDELVALATTTAEQLGKSIDALYAEALERYIEVTKHASAGAARSRISIPRKSPYVTIELPEELCERAEQAAERLEKTRDVLYADALARALAKLAARTPGAASALNQGHDLPSGAWRPRDAS